MGLITAVRVFPNSLVENNRNIPKSNSILFQDEKIILKTGDTETTYSVDFMFDSITTQEEIYNSCIEDMIEKFLGGKNVNLIVIGESGTGKTYTIGSDGNNPDLTTDDEGIIPRAFTDIFSHIILTPTPSTDHPFHGMTLSFIEILNGKIYDLLASETDPKEIQEGVEGVEVLVEKVDDVVTALSLGSSARSEDSHAIFTVTLQTHIPKSNALTDSTVDLNQDDFEKTTISKLRFIDFGSREMEGKFQLSGMQSPALEGVKNVLLSENNISLLIGCISDLQENSQDSISTMNDLVQFREEMDTFLNKKLSPVAPQEEEKEVNPGTDDNNNEEEKKEILIDNVINDSHIEEEITSVSNEVKDGESTQEISTISEKEDDSKINQISNISEVKREEMSDGEEENDKESKENSNFSGIQNEPLSHTENSKETLMLSQDETEEVNEVDTSMENSTKTKDEKDKMNSYEIVDNVISNNEDNTNSMTTDTIISPSDSSKSLHDESQHIKERELLSDTDTVPSPNENMFDKEKEITEEVFSPSNENPSVVDDVNHDTLALKDELKTLSQAENDKEHDHDPKRKSQIHEMNDKQEVNEVISNGEVEDLKSMNSEDVGNHSAILKIEKDGEPNEDENHTLFEIQKENIPDIEESKEEIIGSEEHKEKEKIHTEEVAEDPTILENNLKDEEHNDIETEESKDTSVIVETQKDEISDIKKPVEENHEIPDLSREDERDTKGQQLMQTIPISNIQENEKYNNIEMTEEEAIATEEQKDEKNIKVEKNKETSVIAETQKDEKHSIEEFDEVQKEENKTVEEKVIPVEDKMISNELNESRRQSMAYGIVTPPPDNIYDQIQSQKELKISSNQNDIQKKEDSENSPTSPVSPISDNHDHHSHQYQGVLTPPPERSPLLTARPHSMFSTSPSHLPLPKIFSSEKRKSKLLERISTGKSLQHPFSTTSSREQKEPLSPTSTGLFDEIQKLRNQVKLLLNEKEQFTRKSEIKESSKEEIMTENISNRTPGLMLTMAQGDESKESKETQFLLDAKELESLKKDLEIERQAKLKAEQQVSELTFKVTELDTVIDDLKSQNVILKEKGDESFEEVQRLRSLVVVGGVQNVTQDRKDVDKPDTEEESISEVGLHSESPPDSFEPDSKEDEHEGKDNEQEKDEESEIPEKNVELEELQTKLESQLSLNKKIEQELNEFKMKSTCQLEELQQEKLELRSQLEELKKQLEFAEPGLKTNSHKHEDTSLPIVSLSDSTDNTENINTEEIKNEGQSFEDLKLEMKTLLAELDVVRAQRDGHADHLAACEKQLEELQKQVEFLQRLKSENSLLQQESAKDRSLIEDLQKQIAESIEKSQEYESLLSKFNELETAKNELEIRKSQLETQIDELNASHADKESMLITHQYELVTVKKQLETYQEKAATYEDKVKTLEEEVTTIQANLIDQEKISIDHHEKVENVKEENQELLTRISELETHVAEATGRAEKIANLEREKGLADEKLQELHTSYTTEIEKLKTDLESSQQLINNHISHIEELKTEKSALEEVCNTHVTNLDKAHSRLTKAKDMVDGFTKKIEELESERQIQLESIENLESLKDQMKQALDEKNQILKSKQELEVELTNLQSKLDKQQNVELNSTSMRNIEDPDSTKHANDDLELELSALKNERELHLMKIRDLERALVGTTSATVASTSTKNSIDDVPQSPLESFHRIAKDIPPPPKISADDETPFDDHVSKIAELSAEIAILRDEATEYESTIQLLRDRLTAAREETVRMVEIEAEMESYKLKLTEKEKNEKEMESIKEMSVDHDSVLSNESRDPIDNSNTDTNENDDIRTQLKKALEEIERLKQTETISKSPDINSADIVNLYGDETVKEKEPCGDVMNKVAAFEGISAKEIMDNMQSKLFEAEGRVKIYEGELEKAKLDQNDKENQISKLQNDFQIASTLNKELRGQLDQLTLKFSELETSFSSLESQLHQKSEVEQNHLQIIDSLTSKLSEMETELNTHRDTITQLEAQLVEAKSEQSTELGKLHLKLTELQLVKDSLTKLAREMELKVKDQNNELLSLRGTCAIYKERLDLAEQIESKFKEIRTELEHSVDDLQTEKEELTSKLQTVTSQLDAHKSKEIKLVENLGVLEVELSEVKKELQLVKDEQESSKSLPKDEHDNDSDQSKLKETIEQRQEIHLQQSETIKKLTSELEIANEEIGRLKKEIDEHRDHIQEHDNVPLKQEDLSIKLLELEKLAGEKDAQLQIILNERDLHKEKNESLSSQICDLEAQLSKAEEMAHQTANAAVQEEKKSMKETNKVLKEKIEVLESKLATAEKQVISMENEIESLKNELNELQSKLKSESKTIPISSNENVNANETNNFNNNPIQDQLKAALVEIESLKQNHQKNLTLISSYKNQIESLRNPTQESKMTSPSIQSTHPQLLKSNPSPSLSVSERSKARNAHTLNPATSNQTKQMKSSKADLLSSAVMEGDLSYLSSNWVNQILTSQDPSYPQTKTSPSSKKEVFTPNSSSMPLSTNAIVSPKIVKAPNNIDKSSRSGTLATIQLQRIPDDSQRLQQLENKIQEIGRSRRTMELSRENSRDIYASSPQQIPPPPPPIPRDNQQPDIGVIASAHYPPPSLAYSRGHSMDVVRQNRSKGGNSSWKRYFACRRPEQDF